jgi:Aminopeptidase N
MRIAKLILFPLLIIAVIIGCEDRNGSMETGVSHELAVVRRVTLNNINYNLYFDVPENRDEPINAKATISFDRVVNSADNGVGRVASSSASNGASDKKPLVLDFKADEQQILSVAANGEVVPYLFENEHIVIKSKYMREGSNSITIEFIAGELSLNRNDEFLYTLLVPDRCRTLMPCFDQPDLKAAFELKLKVPKSWKAVGNGELLKMEEFDNHNIYEFERTRPLSTYLFAFTAGQFEYVRQYSRGRWIGIYHRETDAAKIESSIPAIAEQVSYSLDWMERYTDIEYPFCHYNVVAIPDFQYGGMEHPGATYYRSSTLFLSPDADQAAQMRRSELIAHETAHMWFGDLVTMKWFDDVWLKEVFAGLMADKITSGLFPEIDHRLNFFLNHYEPSLRTDRTFGSHPILQKLGNLKDAGTLYGDIIYHKAPIIMQMLERQISEVGLQAGLRQYLAEWQYSNAEWSDLLEVLQNITGRDLQVWNDIWLKEGGAPVVKFDERGIVMEDEKGRGKVWQQTILLGLKEINNKGINKSIDKSVNKSLAFFDTHSVTIEDTLTSLPFSAEEVILPDSDMWGYGSFLPTERGINYLSENISLIPDALQRAMGWQLLYNGVLYKKIAGEDFVRNCLKYLPAEKNNLIINRVLTFLSTVYTTYLDEASRLRMESETEQFFVTVLSKKQQGIDKKPYLRTLLSIYSLPETDGYLYDLLNGKESSQGLTLSEDDKLSIACNIALRNPDQFTEMRRYIPQIVKNGDLLKRFEYVYPALSYDKAVRDSVFNALLDEKNRINEVWVADALRWLNHPLCREDGLGYVSGILSKVEEIQVTGDIFFPANWLQAGLSGHNSKEAYIILKEFLDTHPNYPPNLKLKILVHTDHLRRLHAE